MLQRIWNWYQTRKEHRLILRKVRGQIIGCKTHLVYKPLFGNSSLPKKPYLELITYARDPKYVNKVRISSSIAIKDKTAAQILNELPDHLNSLDRMIKDTKSEKEYPQGGMQN